MCGFSGIFSARPLDPLETRERVGAMTEQLRHRGPDDSGLWIDGDHGIGLGFRRLSIIDLSPAGHQPMVSASGRFVIVFNGEVYNFRVLRQLLEKEGVTFRGHSDTEVVLAAFETWGVQPALERFVGMFAIALWDREQQRLHLVRDRLGIKPLYLYRGDGYVLFGSELRALEAHPGFERTLSPVAMRLFLRYLYIPAPHAIYERVLKVLPGQIVTIENPHDPLREATRYWSLDGVAEEGARSPHRGSDEEMVDELDELLTDSVRLRLEADVPLGALLSGGVDSSAVVSLMAAAGSHRPRTFTIGFDVPEHDESEHARAVAKHLGAEHTALRVSGQDALDIVPEAIGVFDEPFADPSQIPTLLVSKLARKDVTVVLSGDGGDELFAGYNRYTSGSRLIGSSLRIPASLRTAMAGVSGVVPGRGWNRLLQRSGGSPAASSGMVRMAAEKVQKVREVMRLGSEAEMYRSLLSTWMEFPELQEACGGDLDGVVDILSRSHPEALMERMLLADQHFYLPDDLLAKSDRTSMSVGLELRVPIIDHRIVEYSWRLPQSAKVRDGRTKWILRQVLDRHVPRELIDRPKVGFSVPIAEWLQGALRPWAEELLNEGTVEARELLALGTVARTWNRFQSGNPQLGLRLWAVLVLESWLKERGL